MVEKTILTFESFKQLDITMIDASTSENAKISAIGELAPEFLQSKNSEIFIKKIVLIHQ